MILGKAALLGWGCFQRGSSESQWQPTLPTSGRTSASVPKRGSRQGSAGSSRNEHRVLVQHKKWLMLFLSVKNFQRFTRVSGLLCGLWATGVLRVLTPQLGSSPGEARVMECLRPGKGGKSDSPFFCLTC